MENWKKGEKMRISTISLIGSDGQAYITVEINKPEINENDLYKGGLFASFDMDHKKQCTKLYTFSYSNGAPYGFTKCLKTFKDEILSSDECLKYCKEHFKNGIFIPGN